ncbi:hypothetical protein HacjB3_10890 [Halalkalicoccus jeotgali B3]|uniref:Uncharacterized protein n=1 Tax=Halalkalicoccus jeotgali (strain DSM 18796 / CECT 7217 / JCM 14584 / KCTC 4019 / B3) TaxID=795797 RepID=D8J4U4_HALJB|nr:hypothetical protein HacjB3_10890 [Halalkalicoccus jeotgali B3]
MLSPYHGDDGGLLDDRRVRYGLVALVVLLIVLLMLLL